MVNNLWLIILDKVMQESDIWGVICLLAMNLTHTYNLSNYLSIYLLLINLIIVKYSFALLLGVLGVKQTFLKLKLTHLLSLSLSFSLTLLDVCFWVSVRVSVGHNIDIYTIVYNA